MALIVFAITLFVSAFLLFLVQPVIGKFILPSLGGTPQVWNTCMMFFQTVLLTGYFYTHATTTRLHLRRQIVTHIVLLSLPLLVIFGYMAWAPAAYPFDIRNWTPPPGVNPIPATLKLLAITVGIPFFVVSTSAPLLQKWFASTGDPSANDPYFLSVASNVGSLSSLLLYPFLIEPLLERSQQSWMWAIGFMAMIVLFLFAASMVWHPKAKDEALTDAEPAPAPGPAEPEMAAMAIQAATAKMGLKAGKPSALSAGKARDISLSANVVGGGDTITVWRCIHWVLLAAVPSSLMLGVTSYVSVDLSPFPLLWVVPLSLYLLSFILVFLKSPVVWVGVPHRIVTFFSLLGIIWMSLIIIRGGFDPIKGTIGCFFGFFMVALVCHGEMAKDRPSVKHLTLFFLMMSVGGMLGGVFNGLLAPILFNEVLEFPIAIVFACFLHPTLSPIGWTDQLLLDANPQLRNSMTKIGNDWAKAVGMPPPNRPYPICWAIDIFYAILLVLFAWFLKSYVDFEAAGKLTTAFTGYTEDEPQAFRNWTQLFHALASIVPPLAAAAFMSGRGLRYGWAMMGILGFYLITDSRSDRTERVIYSGRSYFGVLKVYRDSSSQWTYPTRGGKRAPFQETATLIDTGAIDSSYFKDHPTLIANKLLHGTTHHGLNFQDPHLARLATTYYHRYGPNGSVMEQYNWFPGKQNTYHADARLAASIVGNLAPIGAFMMPADTLAALPTEPPIAIIGLGTGTMASYGRPFGHVTYYEIDDKIRDMSLPSDKKKQPFFTYLRDAKNRGCNVEVVMGDARLSMEKTREEAREKDRQKLAPDARTTMQQARDGYYKVIVVDAFSSDAIPIHLITKEAIQLYLSKLAPDGVLCVHTSNRHMTLINPVSDIANDLGCDWLVGTDSGDSTSMGHFASEYIHVVHPKPKDYKYMDFAEWQAKDAKDGKPYGNREWGGWLFPVLRAGGPFIDQPPFMEGGASKSEYTTWLKENEARIAHFSKKVGLKPPPSDDDGDLKDRIRDYRKRWNTENEKHMASNRAVRLAVFPHLANLFDWYRKIHPEQRLWTDDYSNIISVLHRGSRGHQEEPKAIYPDLETKAPAAP